MWSFVQREHIKIPYALMWAEARPCCLKGPPDCEIQPPSTSPQICWWLCGPRQLSLEHSSISAPRAPRPTENQIKLPGKAPMERTLNLGPQVGNVRLSRDPKRKQLGASLYLMLFPLKGYLCLLVLGSNLTKPL